MDHISTTAMATASLIANSTQIAQGAEARVYKAYIHASLDSDTKVPILLKHRFKKQYRHPSLDANLTRARVAGEARALLRSLRSGVSVPGLRMVDAAEGVLGIEWIEGKSVRMLLGGGAEGEEEQVWDPDQFFDDATDGSIESLSRVDPLEEYQVTIDEIMGSIGSEIAKMHKADIIHGDLTTSNMIIRHPFAAKGPSPTKLVLIDFGLAYTSSLVEDKAVDLYVLERAFASTHPESEPMFFAVLEAYRKGMGKDWAAVERRLEDVRLRGRKRSMVG